MKTNFTFNEATMTTNHAEISIYEKCLHFIYSSNKEYFRLANMCSHKNQLYICRTYIKRYNKASLKLFLACARCSHNVSKDVKLHKICTFHRFHGNGIYHDVIVTSSDIKSYVFPSLCIFK